MHNKRYYIFVELKHSKYYIPNTTRDDLDLFVVAYQNGSDPFINGRTYSLADFSAITIFETDAQFSLHDYRRFAQISDSREYAIYYYILGLKGFDVTKQYIHNRPTPQMGTHSVEISKTKRTVFIVHGHDNGTLNTVARFLQMIDFDTIILHEQPSEGKTIIEKLEEYTNVDYAVVLYTPCDRGGLNQDNAELKPRARQNVVFEHGFLVGKFGRGKVCALMVAGTEKPSDIDGIVYVDFDNNGAWQMKLANELEHVGLHVDLNSLLTK